MKLTRHSPSDRQIIQRYGNGGFRVSDVDFTGSVLVLPQQTISWTVLTMDQLNEHSFAQVLEHAAALDVFLLGCGTRMERLKRELREALRQSGLVVDTMETGAACRSYNVLVNEGRAVGAGLLAI